MQICYENQIWYDKLDLKNNKHDHMHTPHSLILSNNQREQE